MNLFTNIKFQQVLEKDEQKEEFLMFGKDESISKEQEDYKSC